MQWLKEMRDKNKKGQENALSDIFHNSKNKTLLERNTLRNKKNCLYIV